MNWFVLGNKFELGDLVVDVDLIDRAAFGQPRFFTDWTAICKAIWTVGKWNLCTKFGYERNDAENIAPTAFPMTWCSRPATTICTAAPAWSTSRSETTSCGSTRCISATTTTG